MTFPRPRLALVLLVALCGACRSAAEHRDDADREVYRILDDVRAKLASEGRFRLERSPQRLRVLLEEGQEEVPALSLVEVLQIAAENSREFQTRREALYLEALDLTLQRWDFSVQELGELGAFLSADGDGEARTAGGNGRFVLSKLFESGARLLGSIGIDLARDVSSGDPWGAFSNLSLNVTQPILRGFGRDIVREPLTQAERNVLYEARSFERFRRTFAFDVASRFFNVLAQVDTLDNEELNYQNLTRLRERNEAFAEAGLLSDIQVDQARQDELRAENRVVQARRALEDRLDALKLFLGLPVEVPLMLDKSELEGIQRFEVSVEDLAEEDAATIALRERLDRANVLDRVEDAERRVGVMADALRAGLDLQLGVNATSDRNQLFDFSGDNVSLDAGLALDLPFDRLPERNAYRAALIALDAARREDERSRDEIRAELRDAQRALVAARQSYEIQSGAVVLAERRVESAALNLEAGRASTRDLLEAQESLVQARNAATQAQIDKLLAELAVFRDLELLRVRPEGLSVDVEGLRVDPPEQEVLP